MARRLGNRRRDRHVRLRDARLERTRLGAGRRRRPSGLLAGRTVDTASDAASGDCARARFAGPRRVVAASSDGALANIGSGAGLGDLAVTLGTSGAVRTLTEQPLLDDEARTFCYIADDRRYIVGGPTSSAGARSTGSSRCCSTSCPKTGASSGPPAGRRDRPRGRRRDRPAISRRRARPVLGRDLARRVRRARAGPRPAGAGTGGVRERDLRRLRRVRGRARAHRRGGALALVGRPHQSTAGARALGRCLRRRRAAAAARGSLGLRRRALRRPGCRRGRRRAGRCARDRVPRAAAAESGDPRCLPRSLRALSAGDRLGYNCPVQSRSSVRA